MDRSLHYMLCNRLTPQIAFLPLLGSLSGLSETKQERFGTDSNTNATNNKTKKDSSNNNNNKKSGRLVRKKLPPVDKLYKPLSDSPPSAIRCEDPLFSPTEGSDNLQAPVVGENENLEKPYLRLTTHARKEDVRPLRVLMKSLSHIKNRYARDEDFEWANEQLKSVRQDMTVQRIRNRFVIDVYETHARILLEHGDLDEFNQCQTMIRSLTQEYRRTKGGDDGGGNDTEQQQQEQPLLSQDPDAADEFHGYGILYALVRDSRIELKSELFRAKSSQKEHRLRRRRSVGNHDDDREEEEDYHRESSCHHAVQVVKAIDDNDYRTFFRLYESAPHMSAYLMDFLVKRVRDRAYERIVASYRPSVSVEHFRECLRFEDLEETRRYLRRMGAVFVVEKNTDPPFWVDCKASSATSCTR